MLTPEIGGSNTPELTACRRKVKLILSSKHMKMLQVCFRSTITVISSKKNYEQLYN
jgi:hypothetical protein